MSCNWLSPYKDVYIKAMVMTSGFDEKKVQANTTLFKERFVVKDKAEYDLVYIQREYKDFLGKKNSINTYTYIYNIHNCCWWLLYMESCCFVCYSYYIKFWITYYCQHELGQYRFKHIFNYYGCLIHHNHGALLNIWHLFFVVIIPLVYKMATFAPQYTINLT